MLSVNVNVDSGRPVQVLLAESAICRRQYGLGRLDGLLAPWQVTVERSGDWREAMSRVEHGGLDMAVLSTESCGAEALSALRLVRSHTDVLPCVLITPDTSAVLLRRALELRASSVIRQPADADLVAGLLLRILRKRVEGRWG